MILLSHIQKNLPINFPEYYMNTESEWMMYTERHDEIDPVMERVYKADGICPKISRSGRTFRRWYIMSCRTFRTRQVVLACQIAMESCMFGFNELESLLVNREDEKFHVQMEGLAPRTYH